MSLMGDVSIGGIIHGMQEINVTIGTTMTINSPGTYYIQGVDCKVSITNKSTTIFKGKTYKLRVKDGESYTISGIELSERDMIFVSSELGSYKTYVAKKNGYFDYPVSRQVDGISYSITPREVYNDGFEVNYTSMGNQQPGLVRISDYIFPDHSKIRPGSWAKKLFVDNKKAYADGILYPKREVSEEDALVYTFNMVDRNGDIDEFIEDELSFSSGIALTTDICGSGFSSTSTFVRTRLTFGNSYPSQNTTLFRIHNESNTYSLELGLTPTGYMKSKIVSNGSINTDWTSTTDTYKFSLNTSYDIDFGYINNAYLVKLNGSNNAKFSRPISLNEPLYCTIGSTECEDGEISYSLSTTKVIVGDTITWEPKILGDIITNYTTVGSPVLTDTDMSGFTSESYIITNNNAMDFSNGSWTLYAKFTTGSNVNSQQILFEGENGYRDALRIQIYQGYIYPGYNVNGNWVFMANASQQLQPNTTYWLKVEMADGNIRFSTSLTGSDYQEYLSRSVSSYPSPKKYCIGNGETCPFGGVVHLDETYIEQNGQVLWTPFEEVVSNIRDYYTVYTRESVLNINETMNINGNLVINSEGVASSFSDSSYITLSSGHFTLPMEMYIKFTTGDNISNMQNLFHKNDFMEVFVTGNNLKMWSSMTGEVVIASVTQNTEYWLKIEINQDVQRYFVSTEGFYNYSIEKDVNHTNIAVGSGVMKFGGHNSGGNQWRGTIDFSHLKLITSDGNTWTPYTETITNHKAYGLCTSDFVFTGTTMNVNAYKLTYLDGSFEILLGQIMPETTDKMLSVEVLKTDIMVGDELDYSFTYDEENEIFVSNNYATVVFNVYPPTATVSTRVISGEVVNETDNTVVVSRGSEIEYTVSAEYYQSQTSTVVANNSVNIDITLVPNDGNLDVSEYNTTVENDALIIESYIGDGTEIVLPNIGENNV